MIQPSSNICVLLVDDDPCQLELTETVIHGLDKDLTFEKANSAYKALELIHDQHFDCIVSKYIMPRMSGLELLEKLKAEGHRVPFILFTGQDDEKVVERARLIGVDGYIEKEPNLAVYGVLAQRIKSLVSIDTHPLA